ncbi:hypothetical protein L1987_89179 [Smallanthus sonchifolius]|nr:hypothetical protein L1987_89775 [Smallanthus sonchifolius]KAI3664662.1 hypothetical protein L1987_89571 [Smallanthus sonchifolius]KAI3666096.1 hypothetical protein L1987_89414 [Smallanthus sonchifolius]KAI3666323.1 hypothetical protein L1987_89179 [Smallanthus sonchifolius]
MLSKATELLNHGLRERAKAETEMLMAGIDAHNRMLENKPITIERAVRRSKKSKSLEQGPSSLKTSSSSLFMKQQRSSSARVYDQTLKRVLAKTAFSLPYVKLSFQATTFSSDIEIERKEGDECNTERGRKASTARGLSDAYTSPEGRGERMIARSAYNKATYLIEQVKLEGKKAL